MTRSFLLLCVALATPSFAACSIVRGSGDYAEEERTARNFQAISLEMSATVHVDVIEEGSGESVKVIAEDNLMQYIEVGMRDGALRLGLDDHVIVEPTRPIRFAIEVERLSSIRVEDQGSVVVGALGEGDVEIVTQDMSRVRVARILGDVRVEASDESRVVIDELDAADVAFDLRDSARCDVAGTTTYQDVKIEDTASLRGFGLRSRQARVRAADGSSAELFVTDDLDVTLEDSSLVEVRGNPHTVRQLQDSAEVRLDVEVPDVDIDVDIDG